MARHGKPTEDSELPRFRDRLPEDYPNPDANPYVRSHRSFGRPLLTATDAQQWRGRWEEAFDRSAPLHLEIGTGNGFFLAALAAAHPEWNVLGIEIRFKRVVLTAKKLRKGRARHALIARYDAHYLDDLFVPGSLAAIYVNHPDPWPRVRQAKHRLVSRWFLADCARLLQPGGVLRIKSDFAPNVTRVEDLLSRDDEGAAQDDLPFAITGRAEDVNQSPPPWEDYETNYQRKFKRKGEPVPAIELTRTDP